MTDYGTDVRLDGDVAGDVAVTPTDDLAQIDGPALVAQDIAEAVATPRGSLPWDPSAGSNLLQWLNSPYPRAAEVLAELRRLAAGDPRVDVRTIDARSDRDGHYLLSFRPLGAIDTVALSFDPESLRG